MLSVYNEISYCRDQQLAAPGASHQHLQPDPGQGDPSQGPPGELLLQPGGPAETAGREKAETGGVSAGEQPLGLRQDREEEATRPEGDRVLTYEESQAGGG